MNLELRKAPQTEQRMTGRTILLVDDEPLIRELCAQVLKGYRILEVDNGFEALELLEREQVDVVLTDFMMPRLNGLELLRCIKEKQPHQVVILMTGYAEKETILEALKADADDFITKPINLLQLRTTIERTLEKKTLKEELYQLKKIDRLKSDFLGLVSHKLKTPVTSISLFMQNLMQGIGDPDDPAFRKTLGLIVEETDYLQYLIQDLLEYSEIILQQGGPELAPVDLSKLLPSLLAPMQEQTDKKGVRLICNLEPGLPTLKLDAHRIGFALRALMDNAVKFTAEGGSVTISVRSGDDGLTIQIEDSGIGMTRDELAKIFTKFYQIDPDHTGQVRGFGLGLYYCRQIIKSHGGNLTVESQPGVGTRATVTLPA